MSEWVEVSVVVDGEGAEAVAEAFHRYVHQGVVIEQLFPGEAWPDEPLPTGPLRVAGYFPNDDRADETRRKLEEAVYYLGRLYENIPSRSFPSSKRKIGRRRGSAAITPSASVSGSSSSQPGWRSSLRRAMS